MVDVITRLMTVGALAFTLPGDMRLFGLVRPMEVEKNHIILFLILPLCCPLMFPERRPDPSEMAVCISSGAPLATTAGKIVAPYQVLTLLPRLGWYKYHRANRFGGYAKTFQLELDS